MNKNQAAGLNAILDKVQKGIAEHGWFAITTGQDSPSGMAFTYTIGLQSTWGFPDLVLMGMPYDSAKSYLDKAVSELRAGRGLSEPGHLPNFFGDFDGWTLAVDPARFDEHFRVSVALYPNNTRGLQLIFPDQDRRFPWDPKSAYYKKVPLLGAAPVFS